MIGKFSFVSDTEAEIYCLKIVDAMKLFFDIEDKEAIGRVNKFWQGKPVIGEDDWIYHELPEFWAKWIYYGEVHFWINENNLKPAPYP